MEDVPPVVPASSVEVHVLSVQDELTNACERGDLRVVKAVIEKGARADNLDSRGIMPLGAAIWGMNPKVVNYLLSKMGGSTPLSWGEYKKHNNKWYHSVFLIDNFNPQTYVQWNELFKKIDHSDFLQKYHLARANLLGSEQYESYDFFKSTFIVLSTLMPNASISSDSTEFFHKLRSATEIGLTDFRVQISRKIMATPKLRSIPAAGQLLVGGSLAPKQGVSAPVTPTSQNPYVLIGPKPGTKPVSQKSINESLKLVAEGEQDKTEEMIQKNHCFL